MTGQNEVHLRFCTDPAEFLAVAGDYLAADPVVSNVVTTTAHRILLQRGEGIPAPGWHWWLVVSDASGAVVGAAMRAAPSPPFPPFLLPMPDEAAVALARVLHERAEEVLGVNGAIPAVELCARELIRLGGGRVETGQRTRLHELDDLTWPASVPGGLVVATEDDVDLVSAWFAAFLTDADEQAGRPSGSSTLAPPNRTDVLRQLRDGRIWFWADQTGRPVHLTAANPPSFGVARVGPVYTPPTQRGRGWASNAVAEVSARIQAKGARVCLFTDLANPTSNRIYAALGYRPVVDMASLVIVS